MKNYLALLKILFIQQFRSKPTENNTKKKGHGGKIALIILMIVGFGPLLVMVGACFSMLGSLCAGRDNTGIVAFVILICQGLVVMLGLPSLMTNIFTPRDGDKLLFLPIKTSTIFSAKLSLVYLNEVITSLIVVLVALIPFGAFSGAGAMYYINILFLIILMPVLPLIVGCIVAIPMSAILRKIGKNGVLRVIFQILIFAGIMTLYVLLISSLSAGLAGVPEEGVGEDEALRLMLEQFLSFVDSIGETMKWILPNYLIALAMTSLSVGSSLLNLGAGILVNAVLFGIVILIAIPVYRKTMSDQLEGGGVSKKSAVVQYDYRGTKRGLIASLMLTDFKRVMRDSNLGFQMLLSIIMMPLMVVIMGMSFSMGSEGEVDILKEPMALFIVPLVLLGYMSMLGSTANTMGLYPISRENKSFYMLKVMPIPVHKMLLAKVLLATILLIVANAACAIAGVLIFNIRWYSALFMFVAMSLFQFGAMCITMYFDLKKPVLNWVSFNQSLKNAKNGFIALLIGFLTLLVVAGVGIPFGLWYFNDMQAWKEILAWLVLIGIGIGYSAITFNFLKTKAVDAFNRIEV